MLTHYIKHEADESMVRSKRQQHTIDQHNMLEVVDDTLSIEKVHGGTQEVPVQGLGEAQRSSPAGNVGDGNDLLEGDDLNCSDDDNHIDVTGEHGSKEDANHGKGPDRAGDEGLLLLLILRDLCGLDCTVSIVLCHASSFNSSRRTLSSSFSVAHPLAVVSVRSILCGLSCLEWRPLRVEPLAPVLLDELLSSFGDSYCDSDMSLLLELSRRSRCWNLTSFLWFTAFVIWLDVCVVVVGVVVIGDRGSARPGFLAGGVEGVGDDGAEDGSEVYIFTSLSFISRCCVCAVILRVWVGLVRVSRLHFLLRVPAQIDYLTCKTMSSRPRKSN